jgi:hypothetical protein
MQIQDLEEKIDEQKDYIQTLRESMGSVGGMNTNPDKVQTSGTDKNKLENIIIKVVDAEAVLKQMQERCALLKVQIAEQIHMMDDLKLKRVLKLRYIDWKEHDTLMKVADEMGYSYDHMKVLHREAIDAFGRMLTLHNP